MGSATKIEWARSTFNPWWGCTEHGPECANCYAEAFAKRTGHAVWGPKTPRRFFGDKHWAEPRKWNAEAAKTGEPWRVFCASMADVFEDRSDLDEHRFRLWRLIDETPALTWLLLTKRPENHEEMVPVSWRLGQRPPPNVWLGTTCGIDRPASYARVDTLRRVTWARRIFVSAEPLLTALPGLPLAPDGDSRMVDWLITGAESGAGHRAMNESWVRDLRDEAAAAGTAFFYKQKVVGHLKVGLPVLDGRQWAEVPAR